MNKLDPKRMRKGYVLALCLATLVGATVHAGIFTETTLTASTYGDTGDIRAPSAGYDGWSMYVGNLHTWSTDGKGFVRFNLPTLQVGEEIVSATLRLRTREEVSNGPRIRIRYAANDSWTIPMTYDQTTYGGGAFDFQTGATVNTYFRAIDGSTELPVLDYGQVYVDTGIWYEYDVLSFMGLPGEGSGATMTLLIDHSPYSGEHGVTFYGRATTPTGPSYPELILTSYIPEPTAFALVGLGALPLMMRRRRR